MKKTERVTRHTSDGRASTGVKLLKKEGDMNMKRSRAVRLVVLVVIVCLAGLVIVCLAGLLQSGPVLLSHASADEYARWIVTGFSVDEDFGTAKPGDYGTEGDESSVIDGDFGTEYTIWGNRWDNCPSGAGLTVTGTASINFEPIYVRELRVNFLVEIVADDKEECEYSIKVHSVDDTWLWVRPPESSCPVDYPFDESIPVNLYIDAVHVEVEGLGEEGVKCPYTADVNIKIQLTEIQPTFGFQLWAVKYEWGEKGWQFVCDEEGNPVSLKSWLHICIDNPSLFDAYDVRATISESPVNTTLIDPVAEVGNIPDGNEEPTCSTDTFAIEVDLTEPVNACAGVAWDIDYYDSQGWHYLLDDVPQFPPGEGPCDQ